MDDNLKKWLPWIAVGAVAIIVIALFAFNSGDDEEVAATTTTSSAEETTTSAAEETTTTSTPEETTTTSSPIPATVRVGVENLYPPFNFIDEATGEGAGFDYDFWNEICNRLGCTAEFVEAGWPAVIEETGQGVYDAAADGITITDDRKKIVAFSDEYMNTIQKIMVQKNDDRFTTATEFLEGDYSLGTQVGTSNYELATTLIDENRIEGYDSFPFAVQTLLIGDLDGVIIDDVAGQGYVGEGNEGTKLLDGDLQSDPLGFIYPHDSVLIGPVNQVIADMKADGSLDALITKWFIDFTS